MSDEPKPKLIIDEDWKTKVEREREEQKHAAEQVSPQPTPSAASSTAASGRVGDEDIPPASFQLLVTMLATQTLAALGMIHDPSQGEPHVEPKIAQHFIDLLGMLETKTKGNLSAEENSLLNQTLHELRMLYVARK